MKIRLSEIPAEGRQYDYDRASGELNAAVEDLLSDHDYKVDLFIKPIGNAYEMRGQVKAVVTELCSSCGYEFEMPIGRKVNEILIEEQKEDRKAHSVHGNSSVDFNSSGPSVATYRNDLFDIGAFVHEAIALEEPFYPMCGPSGECLRRDEVRTIRERLEAEFAGAEESSSGHPAFAVLKGISSEKKN